MRRFIIVLAGCIIGARVGGKIADCLNLPAGVARFYVYSGKGIQ